MKFRNVLDGGETTPPILIDIATSWASRFILKVTALGVMESYENHTFLPKKIINRAELAETLVRLVNFLKNKGYRFTPQMAPDRIQISDVPPDNYFHAPIVQIIVVSDHWICRRNGRSGPTPSSAAGRPSRPWTSSWD